MAQNPSGHCAGLAAAALSIWGPVSITNMGPYPHKTNIIEHKKQGFLLSGFFR